MPRIRLPLLALTLLALVFGAACSDDGGEDGDGDATTTVTTTATTEPEATATATEATSPTTEASATGTALAETFDNPFDYCGAVGTIDAVDERYTGARPHDDLLDALATAEELPERFSDPAARLVDIPWRCVDGEVLACDPGANLPCGPANDSDEPTAAMVEHCQANPDGIIPAVVTGHDTVYSWTCDGETPTVDEQVFTVDDQGFVAEMWYQLERPE